MLNYHSCAVLLTGRLQERPGLQQFGTGADLRQLVCGLYRSRNNLVQQDAEIVPCIAKQVRVALLCQISIRRLDVRWRGVIVHLHTCKTLDLGG